MSDREVLTTEEAIRAMLDGETLINTDGYKRGFCKKRNRFYLHMAAGCEPFYETISFDNLSRLPQPKKRLMTRWECLAWANSEESRGWVGQEDEDNNWVCPQCLYYTDWNLCRYRRARLLPDLSGIDESTICGFEVEEDA